MSKGLSRREKVLLVVLGAFLLIFGSVYFLIMPIAKWKADAAEILETARMAQTQAVARVSAVKGLAESNEKTKEAVEESAGKIASFNQVEFIDKEITQLCLKNNLTPITFSMLPDEEFDGGGILVKYNLELLAEGAADDLLKINDYVNDRYSLRLTSFEYANDFENPPAAAYVLEAVLKTAERAE